MHYVLIPNAATKQDILQKTATILLFFIPHANLPYKGSTLECGVSSSPQNKGFGCIMKGQNPQRQDYWFSRTLSTTQVMSGWPGTTYSSLEVILQRGTWTSTITHRKVSAFPAFSFTLPWLFGSGKFSRDTKCITVVFPVGNCNAGKKKWKKM